METPRVLIADDQPHVLEALQLLLKNEGFLSETVNSPGAVVEAVQDRNFDVLLLDLNYARDTTSGAEGLQLLSRIRELDSALPVVLMTAWGSIELAVEAMQGGGRDFLQKPWDNEKLVSSLRRQIEEGRLLREKKRELDEARAIQQRFLPAEMPKLRGCDIQAFWKPLNGVGGDYFDAMQLDDSTVALCIADVAGKGLPAALLMSNMQATVRRLMQATCSPAQLCRQFNRVAVENTTSERFVTLFYAVLDLKTRTLRYTNAGHVPPMLVRAGGTIERLCDGGTVLGAFGDSDYDETQIDVRAGDRMVFVTDGITEARNVEDEEFGDARLAALLLQYRDLEPAQLQRVLIDSVVSFAGEALQDDATIMIVSCD